MHHQNIPISWALRHCEGLVRQGQPLEPVLARALIERTFGDDRDRVSFGQFGLLLLTTAHWAADDASALAHLPVAAGLGVLAGHIMLGCATLEHALDAVSQLYRRTPVQYAVQSEGDEAVIVVHAEATQGCPLASSLEELFAVFLFGLNSLFLGRPMALRAFQTRDPWHANLNATHWGTFAPVRLAPVTGLRIPRSLLAARRVGQGSDQIYWDMSRPWLAAAEAHQALAEAHFIDQGSLRLEVLAEASATSVGTLRRRMARTEGGFRQVRRSVVLEASLQLLRTSSRSVESIAAELGYAEARSFRRFLKSATGRTPEALRREVMPSAPAPALLREAIRDVALAMSH